MSLNAQMAEQIRDGLVKAYEHESQTTLKVIKAVPNDKLAFTPHAKSMSMNELVWHTVVAEQMFLGGILKGAFGKETLPTDLPKDPPKTITEIASVYEKLTAARISELKSASGEMLGKELNFHDFMKMPAIHFLQICMNHTIHHRGQLTVYLRLVDAPVPSVYGPSADDNPFAKK